MSKDPRSTVNTNLHPPNMTITDQLEKLITIALAKLKNIWKPDNALTGIQFYGDRED